MTFLNNRVIGKGRPVVFLHGFLESLIMWDYLPLENLGVQVILIDLPGHGKSYLAENAQPSISYMAEQVRLTLNTLKLEEYEVVGHSMGGYVALELARCDERCKKIVLLNSNFWSDSEAKRMDRLRVAEIVQHMKSLFLNEAIPNLFIDPTAQKDQVDQLIKEANAMDSASIAYASIAMSEREDYSAEVNNEKFDLYVIQGEKDTIVPHELMNEKLTVKEKTKVISECGHMCHIEAPDQVMEALSIFLK
jgi:pimeloyl-ACP methyl ester carboxylesterase